MQAAANATNLDLQRIKRILMIQLVLFMVLTLIALLWSQVAALSTLLGGLVASIGNALFALWVFSRYRAQDPGKLVLRFYGAELVKVLVVLTMFAAVFYWVESIMPAVFLSAFFVTQVLPPMLAHGLGE